MSSADASAPQIPTVGALHRAIAFNRLLTLCLGGLILVMLASWLTLGLFYYFDDQPKALQSQLYSLEQELAALKQQQAQHTQELLAQQQQLTQLDQVVQQRLEQSPSVQLNLLLASTLAQQEISYQQNILVFKEGMRDLASMIPGSRDWLEHYETALERAKVESQQRRHALQQWLKQPAPATETSAPNTAPH